MTKETQHLLSYRLRTLKSTITCPAVKKKKKGKKEKEEGVFWREYSLRFMNHSSKLHQAYKIFLPLVQRLVRGLKWITASHWSTLSGRLSKSLVKGLFLGREHGPDRGPNCYEPAKGLLMKPTSQRCGCGDPCYTPHIAHCSSTGNFQKLWLDQSQCRGRPFAKLSVLD